MLQTLQENLDKIDYLYNYQNELNVGLLAAKALDFDKGFIQYGESLHDIWQNVLTLIGQKFQTPTFGNRKKAYDFYKANTHPIYSDNKIANHMTGIDFSHSVNDSFLICTGDKITQWKVPNIPQGDYYADLFPIWCDCLGIHRQQEDKNGIVADRELHIFEVKLHNDINALKSTAADVLDTWSIKGKSFMAYGGCTQYFHTNKQNLQVKRNFMKYSVTPHNLVL